MNQLHSSVGFYLKAFRKQKFSEKSLHWKIKNIFDTPFENFFIFLWTISNFLMNCVPKLRRLIAFANVPSSINASEVYLKSINWSKMLFGWSLNKISMTEAKYLNLWKGKKWRTTVSEIFDEPKLSRSFKYRYYLSG